MSNGDNRPPDNLEPPNACSVCADAGEPMTVLDLQGSEAICLDDRAQVSTVAVDFVSPVQIGETLLVHGGVAIGRVVATIEEPEREPFVERRNLEKRPWTGRVSGSSPGGRDSAVTSGSPAPDRDES